MADKPKDAPFFTVDDTGNQLADLHSFFLSDEGKEELKDTARALVKSKIPGLPDEATLAEPSPARRRA